MGIVVAAIVLVLVIGVVIVLLSGMTMVESVAFGRKKPEDMPPDRLLYYRVPDGQDPAVVMSALRIAGFQCTVDAEHAHHDVVIMCPNGRDEDRKRVREVIAGVHATNIGEENPGFVVPEVHFADERPPAST